ncbi:hypothetical protein JCM3770_000053 [Rhodotorula araucariae]
MATDTLGSIFPYLAGVDALDTNSEHYTSWRARVFLALNLARLADHVGPPALARPEAPGDQPEWDCAEVLAKMVVTFRLAPRLECLLLAKTAGGMIEALDKRFLQQRGHVHRAITTTLDLLKAASTDEIPRFLDVHEATLAKAITSGYPFARPIRAGATAAEIAQQRGLHVVYTEKILGGLPSTVKWRIWTAFMRHRIETDNLTPDQVLIELRNELAAMCGSC